MGYNNVDTLQLNSPRVRKHRGRVTRKDKFLMSLDSTSRVPVTCLHCGSIFQPKNADQKFCGRKCYGKHLTRPLEERFWSRVEKTNSCWVWTGYTTSGGYGQIVVGGRHLRAHRVSFTLIFGFTIPEGYQLHHICNNPLCVRPDHLQCVTPKEHVFLTPQCAAAVNARKTHCPDGHPYEEKNTHGFRSCRICARKNRRALRNLREPDQRVCFGCGKPFYPALYNKKSNCQFCSRECYYQRGKQGALILRKR